MKVISKTCPTCQTPFEAKRKINSIAPMIAERMPIIKNKPQSITTSKP